jgi:hypothetical protein
MDLLLSFVDFESFKEMMLFSRAHLVASTPKMKSSKAAALGLKGSGKAASSTTWGDPAGATQGKKKMKEEELKHYEECIDMLQISGRPTRFHKDEQEEGDHRPDLNFMLGVSKISKR